MIITIAAISSQTGALLPRFSSLRAFRALLLPTIFCFSVITVPISVASEIDVVFEASAPSSQAVSKLEIKAFSTLPDKIFEVGDSASLSWFVEGATTVMLTNNTDGTRLGPFLAQGIALVSPESTTTYTLSAEGPAGTKNAQVRIAVASSQPQYQWKASPQPKSQWQQRYQAESITASLTTLKDGAVYQGSFDGNYYRFSDDGALVWALDGVGIAMNPAAVADDLAFVGTNSAEGGRIFALKPDKSILWEVRTPSGMTASPILNADNSRVYGASYGGTILGLNTADGNEQWRYQLPEGETVSAAPTLSADGTVLYVQSTSHKVFALNTDPPASPALPRQISIPLPDGPVLVVPYSGAPPQTGLKWSRDLVPTSGH